MHMLTALLVKSCQTDVETNLFRVLFFTNEGSKSLPRSGDIRGVFVREQTTFSPNLFRSEE